LGEAWEEQQRSIVSGSGPKDDFPCFGILEVEPRRRGVPTLIVEDHGMVAGTSLKKTIVIEGRELSVGKS